MKRRMITAAALLLFFCALMPWVGYNVHMCLSGSIDLCGADPELVFAGLAIPQVRQFTSLGVFFALLGVGWMLFSQSYIKYRNGMRRITPNIWTPAPAGEGQYGTAFWMKPEEYGKHFYSVQVDYGSHRLQSLITCGRDRVPEKGVPHEE